MTQNQERFVETKVNYILGKNGGHMPSSLAVGQLLWSSIEAARQAGKQILAVYKKFKIQTFNSKACLGCLEGFMVLLGCLFRL